LTQNAAYIRAKNLRAGASGISGATPRSRRAKAELKPTTNARPIACSESIAVYAKSEGDSRTQVANALLSMTSSQPVSAPRDEAVARFAISSGIFVPPMACGVRLSFEAGAIVPLHGMLAMA